MAPRNAVTSTALPRTPVTNTGLRPTRSESRAQNGMVQIATRLATIASQSMKVLLKPMPKSSEVAKFSAKTWNIVLTMAMKAAKKTRSTFCQWSRNSTPRGALATSSCCSSARNSGVSSSLSRM